MNPSPKRITLPFDKRGLAIGSYAVTVIDHESDPGEQRLVTLGTDAHGRVLVVVYTHRGEDIRLISARPATPREPKDYEARR